MAEENQVVVEKKEEKKVDKEEKDHLVEISKLAYDTVKHLDELAKSERTLIEGNIESFDFKKSGRELSSVEEKTHELAHKVLQSAFVERLHKHKLVTNISEKVAE